MFAYVVDVKDFVFGGFLTHFEGDFVDCEGDEVGIARGGFVVFPAGFDADLDARAECENECREECGCCDFPFHSLAVFRVRDSVSGYVSWWNVFDAALFVLFEQNQNAVFS